jgi:cytidine deaminase
LDSSEGRRLSVSLVDVFDGCESDFAALAAEYIALLRRKQFGRAEMIPDESRPLRFYAVQNWIDSPAAERCHRDLEVQALMTTLHRIARVTHVVNGVARGDSKPVPVDDRRARIEPDRRAGFDRRAVAAARPEGDRRASQRRQGPRRARDRRGAADLVGAARRAREHAAAAFSNFKVGAALESADGTVFTGCNVENATYGLTMCAERVAVFKAVSEGHRAFTRIAIVAETDEPTPPCGACRQILWEFGGNLEILLANLTEDKGRHRLADLLPLPFDARLL